MCEYTPEEVSAQYVWEDDDDDDQCAQISSGKWRRSKHEGDQSALIETLSW